MNSNEMLRVQNAVFILQTRKKNQTCNKSRPRPRRASEYTYLSSSIHDLSSIVLAIVFDDSAKGILDCWVIAFNEVMLDETDSQGGFA